MSRPPGCCIYPVPSGSGLGRRSAAASVAFSPRDRCCAAILRAADRFPYPRRRRRHVDMVDAERLERVDERVDHRRRRADGAGFTDALDPERLVLHGTSSRSASISGIVSARGMP